MSVADRDAPITAAENACGLFRPSIGVAACYPARLVANLESRLPEVRTTCSLQGFWPPHRGHVPELGDAPDEQCLRESAGLPAPDHGCCARVAFVTMQRDRHPRLVDSHCWIERRRLTSTDAIRGHHAESHHIDEGTCLADERGAWSSAGRGRPPPCLPGRRRSAARIHAPGARNAGRRARTVGSIRPQPADVPLICSDDLRVSSRRP